LALADIARLPRNAQRLGEIIVAFARHGFGPLVARLNLHEHIPFAKRLLAKRPAVADKTESTEQGLVNAFSELGASFVKLGQILSSRPDIVGDSCAEAFKQLRDQARPFDTAVARRIIEAELRAPIGDIFASFDDEPAGCGSIAQVHSAILKDGTQVMVKVRRPGVESAILADMAILRKIASIAEPQFPEIRPIQIIEEFDRAIRNELDFTAEAASTAKFRALLKDNDAVCAPAVFWEFTTAAVLTIERFEGVPIGNIEELERRGHDRKRLAKDLGECFMNQYFRSGMFHADPHPGNLLVLDDGTIGVIDFGMVGHLSSDVKNRLTTMFIAAVTEDIDFIADAAAELGDVGEEFDQRQFASNLADLYHKYSGMPLGRMDTRRLFGDLTRVARQNDLALPRDLVLLGKSVAAVSAVARSLDPSYDVIRMSAPKTEELIRDKLSPTRLAKTAGLSAISALNLLKSIPRDLRSIVRKVESGQLQIGFRHHGLERTVTELDRASNRLAISIYVAALLVASSLMMRGEFLSYHGISVPGLLGYMLAGLLSVGLAWGICRSGRL
jgi:ubiquinone biosynthesis protein